MTACKKIKGRNQKVCIADLDRLILLQNRAIKTPVNSSPDFTELFSDAVTAPNNNNVWAMIESVNGVTVFDGTNIERIITHKFYVRYDEAVTAQTWILFGGIRYDIVKVEDLDLRHDFMCLFASERGISSNSVNSQ